MQTLERVIPRNRLGELDVQHVVHPLTNLHAHQMQGPLIWDRGEGIYLYDTNGKRYIDAAAGMWNVNVGHGRTELAEVAATQMGRLEYASSFGGASNQPSIELAERVARLVPGDLNTILFTAGGSESNDSAFKLARLYWKQRGMPKKRTIIGRYMGYHGLTLATTQATGIPHDILLIADEVITGFGRTGMWFAMEQWNVVPDMMTVAKGISSGYVPLGGVILSNRVREPIYGDPALTLMHGFTYTGHPVACAVGLRNIEIIEREGLVERAARVGSYFLDRLREIGERYERVGEVRGLGMMAGIEFVLDRATRTEAAQADRIAAKVSRQALGMGLICRPMPGSDVLAFSPPLIANEGDVDRICEVLDEAISAVCGAED
ncbi:MAG: aspartate aminotransferase family protein [Thermomicrobiales bacterium]|nr:aspartate aminotransferase family protein [Thermomicrobiales bacterium]